MTETIVYPLTFEPVFRNYIWGGRRLESLFARSLPPGIVAESWEISGHLAGSTPVKSGYWAGQPLPAVLAALGEKLVGARAGWALRRGRFPLLVKLLDAAQDLSVQVHPDDEYALAHENGELGKTEMWYVLYAEPGARLVLGLRPGTTRGDFKEALEAGRLEDVLRYLPVRAGEAVPVPAGTVHALLAGIVVTEIQQNSDTTYRVYDWGRVGTDGRPRPLHIEKALDVIAFGEEPPQLAQPACLPPDGGLTRCELVRSPYFVVDEIVLAPGASWQSTCDGSSLEIWGCMAGEVHLEWAGTAVRLPAVRYALLPAALGGFRVRAILPSACLRVYLP
jgi:mannose-6-phosphate isomerase